MKRLIAGVIAAILVPMTYGQATTNPEASSAAAAPVSARTGPLRAGWWNDRVFYEVFVRSFKDSTSGPLADDGVGDLRGLIEQLDYLNDGKGDPATSLGVGGLWLMPVHPSPTYHGYDVSDYRAIHEQYGSMEDFRLLMAECHKRDIRVIIDFVMNHCSEQHAWFKDARQGGEHRDWFVWSQTDPGWKGPWNQRVWHRAGNEYYYGIFNRTMPDLNFRAPGPTQAMRDIATFWLKDVGVDGFRLDAIRHLIEEGQVQESTPATHEWLRGFYTHYKSINPEAICIGEVWAASPQAAAYVGDQMDLTFEFAMAQAVRDGLKTGSSLPYRKAIAQVQALYPPNQYGAFLTNHDMTRVMTELGDPRAMRAAAALYLLGPGVPFVYYGEELGMPGDKPDPELRTPMPWTDGAFAGFSSKRPWKALTAGFQTRNVQSQSADQASLLNWYRRLIHLRNTSPALRHGGLRLIDAGHPAVFAAVRDGPGETIVVVVNCGREPVEVVLSGAGAEGLVGVRGEELLGGAGAADVSRPGRCEPLGVRVYRVAR